MAKKNNGSLLIALAVGLVIAVVITDRLYIASFTKKLEALESKRIAISNKLATAKIVQENLNHVRDLVFENMDFPGQKDSVTPESRLFEFISGSVADLKLKLVSCKPMRPVIQGNQTIYGYELEVEGDFFSIGELFAKFENSRRIVSVEQFSVSSQEKVSNATSSDVNAPRAMATRATMTVNTYRLKKSS